MNEPINPPEGASWRDATRQMAIAAANLVTFGAAGVLVDIAIPSKLDRRRDEFDAGIAEKLNRLEEMGKVVIKPLEQNDEFITAKVMATVAAVFTHEQEKRAALRNAVLNVALGVAPDETRQQIFLRWISELTSLHLQVLEWSRVKRVYPRNLAELVEKDFPGSKPLHLAAVIVKDLVARELIKPDVGSGGVHRETESVKTTTLGSAFLSFIRDPLDTPNTS